MSSYMLAKIGHLAGERCRLEILNLPAVPWRCSRRWLCLNGQLLALLCILCFLSRLVFLGLRVRVALPFQLPRLHEALKDLIGHLSTTLLEVCHLFLKQLDRHFLQLAREQLTALVLLVHLLDLRVVLLKVRKVDVRNIDVGVSTQLPLELESLLTTAEGVLVDLGLLRVTTLVVTSLTRFE